MCIISSGKNLMKNKKYLEYLQSINRQNYTNFKVVIIDDASTDKSLIEFSKEILHSSKLKKRTILIKNS